MDQESIVYGCIKDMAFGNQTQRRMANRNAMLKLPKQDGGPFICQEMFSLPRKLEGECLTEVMHFGSSYRAIEYEWEQWIAKFEELLGKMYWVSATVHLETELSGTHSFTWESNKSFHVPNSGDMQVRCEWQQDSVF
ncbi:MAG: hypothetical protein K6L73_04170 [Cellvibrionaceae bacterium]